ncbi:uncharacterized secreted protein ARB_06907 isoform X1 [Nematostella vectensis]|uniref:uncharacterized secreted protein ARB_06907 isoform X1 n=1 Tax=Nematostella vectensis TaxID=45351 RepID=UPI00138FF2D1|nr:uncharacterized secreted protein ARB_06907 isoform X1 [Nematostella vectensis]
MMYSVRITIIILLVNAALVLAKKSSPAEKLVAKEVKNSGSLPCKSTKVKYLRKLREFGSREKLMTCLLKILNDKNSKNTALLWTMLGEIFNKRNEKSKANICFKESSSLMGRLSTFVSEWHFIGPFTIGKSEVDGDPLEDWGGVKNVSMYRWDDQVIHLSELAPNGEIKWHAIKASSATAPVQVLPPVDWNELVMSLQSMGIAEWQGWVLGDVIVNEEATVLFQALGVTHMYIDDVMLPGDVYRRDQFWYPIQLTQGVHTVQIKLRAKGPVAFNMNLKMASERQPIKILKPTFQPDIVNGKLFSRYISIPISNYDYKKWVKVTGVRCTKQDSLTASLYDAYGNSAIAPGQTKNIIIKIGLGNKEDIDTNCSDLEFVAIFSFDFGRDEKIALKLRCRRRKESFLFTFVDHDGSLQHAAVIEPLSGCTSVCPVLLTLHGTTVPPQNQADSYKRMENGKWVFGVEHLWVLAPTRHGAHNWEGPGELTAVTALSRLAELTNQASWVENKASDRHIVIAGHSMGGHGAWQLGTHYPDNTLALISAAGWIRKEDYGDSNLFFRHDVSTSHVDPIVKSLMESCVAENDADKHVSNLHGIPVMIRTGAKDQTVHPYFSRRMYRLLRQQRSNVTYAEIPGKEHWWWDTYRTNDGGVTNDPVIRNFAITHVPAGQITAETCGSSGGRCDEGGAANKYKDPLQFDRNLFGDGVFTLTLYNPASSKGVRGVRVLQQLVPFRKTVVRLQLSRDSAILRTSNAARISLEEPAVSPVRWAQRPFEIDDTSLSLKEVEIEAPVHICRTDDNKWQICKMENYRNGPERGPWNYGPARRVVEAPYLIVAGTRGDVSDTKRLRQYAVYIANLFHVTSEGVAPVVMDTDLDDVTSAKFNLIVIGSSALNSWTKRFATTTPLQPRRGGITLGNCNFQEARTGALWLAPHGSTRLALILTGNSLEGLEDIIHLATPTIPPMTRSPFSNLVPDYVITGPRFGARGPGGYLCTGFWGNSWEYRRDVSSCTC